jgi:hypothetical protein
LFPPKSAEVTEAWEISEQTLRLMNDLCQLRGVPFWIMTLDVAGQTDPDRGARRKFLNDLGTRDPYYADSRLVRFAEQSGIPHIQTAPILAEYAARTGHCLHGFFNTARNFGHLNAKGHDLLGTILADEILHQLL